MSSLFGHPESNSLPKNGAFGSTGSGQFPATNSDSDSSSRPGGAFGAGDADIFGNGDAGTFGTTGGHTTGETASQQNYGRNGSAVRASLLSTSWTFIGSALASAVAGVIISLLAFVLVDDATDVLFALMAVVGWLLSGIVAFILVGLHKAAENRCRAEGPYVQKHSHILAMRATFILGSLGVLISAIEISLWVSKTVGVA